MASARANSFEDLRNRISGARETLPKRLGQAAEYVLSNPDEMALGTAASVSQAAQVQPSTMVRLARHLGYDGFSDMQSVFRERLRARASNYEERLDQIHNRAPSDTIDGTVLNGFLATAQQSLERLMAHISEADFARAVAILSQAETIFLVARRRAYPITAHLSYSFAKLGVRAEMVNSANGIDDEIVARATPRDAAFVCSFAPYGPQTVALTEKLAQGRVPVVAVTDSALSPLAPLAQAWIEIAEDDYAGFRSIAASMAVASALPVAIAERRRHIQ